MQAKLKELLKKRNITYRNVSAVINITERSLCQKINGENSFKWDEVKAICKYLGIKNPFDVFV